MRAIPAINGWAKSDLKMEINHEDDNDSSAVLELQFGKMLIEKFGVYGELLVGDVSFDTNAYDYGPAVAPDFDACCEHDADLAR